MQDRFKETENIGDTIVYKNGDGTGYTGIYEGTFDNLTPFNKELLTWHKDEEFSKVTGVDMSYLTLAEISKQLEEMLYKGMLIIFVNNPLQGTIYQMGNYGNYEWSIAGTLRGYA